jgi:hypothetical protein
MKERSAKQLANDARLREMAKARAKAPVEDKEDHIAEEQSVTDLQRQVKEMQQNMDAMRQMMMQSQNNGSGVQMNQRGELIGEWEKYVIDPANYPDPTPRLRKESRLQPLAFDYNYEMEYEVGRTNYQTLTGKNMVEPKFRIVLNRIVLNDQGEQTDKRYIARKMIFFEDPEAALVIARENGLEVDKSDEKLFLNEMRYLRIRDWLFDIFWPKPADEMGRIKEEIIGGTIVQVFTKSSEDSSSIPFDKLESKLRG